MADVNFSYGFTRYPLKSGGHVDRPMISARLTHTSGKEVDTDFLLDSGADVSMIPSEIAGSLLGIDVDRLPRSDTNSVSGQIEVGIVELTVTIEQNGRRESFKAPFQVPINCPGFPTMPLLGRQPLFELFDVSFRGGYTTSVGKFTLRKVTKKRPADDYRAGGRALP